MNHLLVVCEGNICRSPMGAALFGARGPKLQARSAGLGALVGRPADETATRLMRSLGIDISAHRAVQLTRRMCLEADLVLVMDREQRQRVEKLYPEACGRVFRLGEFIEKDIPDPYRQPERAFRDALELIEQGVARWLQRIERL